MSSAISSSISINNTDAQSPKTYPSGFDFQIPNVNNNDGSLLHPKPQTSVTKHFTSLQEHADYLHDPKGSAEDEPLTPMHESRREGVFWGGHPAQVDQIMNIRSPFPPVQPRTTTPPSLQEIMRRATNDNTYSDRHLKLQRTDTTESQSNVAHLSRSSSLNDSIFQNNTRRSSVAAFAKHLARHVPDVRLFAAAESKGTSQRRDSQDASSLPAAKKGRKLSFTPPSAMKSKESFDKIPKYPVMDEKQQMAPCIKPSELQLPAKGGLRDRRKVKLDLSMPAEIPDISPRSPFSVTGNLSSLIPSRPRSPKTPWTRSEQPKWELSTISKSAPIMEEDYIQNSLMGEHGEGSLGPLPDGDTIFSPQSTRIQRPSPRFRDLGYTSRPRVNRTQSRESRTSGLNAEDIFAADRTLDNANTLREQVRIETELQELGQTSKASRTSRWRWKQSSDEALQAADTPNRRCSINPFKRSNRISDSPSEKDEKSPTSPRPFWRWKHTSGTQPSPSSLAHMQVPPPFVPPGLNRVPTPPTFDEHGEVLGKLADFAFDIHDDTPGLPRRKPRPSPGSIWDSDALLMSLNVALTPNEEDEEEGPGGPSNHALTPAIDFDVNGSPRLLPGLAITPGGGGYLGAKFRSNTLNVQSPMLLDQDTWFRIQHDEMSPEGALSTLAIREDEERRKFEWLIPEHLPGSPLCPLHPIYKGPSKGVCLWHGKKKVENQGTEGNKGERGENGENDSSWNSGGRKASESDMEKIPRIMRGTRGWQVGKWDLSPKEGKKRRRLVSLSGP